MAFQIDKSSEFKDYIVRHEDRFSFRLTEVLVLYGHLIENKTTGKITLFCFIPDEIVFTKNLGFTKTEGSNAIYFENKKEATKFLFKLCKICEAKHTRYNKFKQKLLK